MRQFTKDQVLQSRDTPLTLVILDGKVLDITEFVHDHPGGDAILMKFSGQDITHVFRSREYHMHSPLSMAIVESLTVGTLGQNHSQRLAKANDNEQLLDLSRPLIPQFFNSDINKARYLKLVHRPRHHEKCSTIFPSPILEILTHTHWAFIPLIWGSLALYLSYSALASLSVLQYCNFFGGEFFYGHSLNMLCIDFYSMSRNYCPIILFFLLLTFLRMGSTIFYPWRNLD